MNYLAHQRHFAIVLLTFVTLWQSPRLPGDEYYVRVSGNDSNPGRNPKQAFRTIGRASQAITDNDTIIIGAGTYTESVDIDVRKIVKSGTISFNIVGDATGQLTGDKGPIVLQVPPTGNNWALRFQYANNVSVTGIQFVGQGSSRSGFGCYWNNSIGRAIVRECSFSGLAHSIYSLSEVTQTVEKCLFENVNFGLYSSKAASVNLASCSFLNARNAIEVRDTASATVADSQFSAAFNANKVALPHDALRAFGSSVTMSGCKVLDASQGVFGTGNKSFFIKGCSIANPTSWGVNISGDELGLYDCEVTGPGTRTGNGVNLQSTSTNKSILNDVRIAGMNHGLASQQGEYSYEGVSVSKCHIGLYFSSGNPYLLLDDASKIEFQDNFFALYSEHPANRPGKLEVRRRDFRNNNYAIYCLRTDVAMEACLFTENGYGAQLNNCPSISVRECQFINNNRAGFPRLGLYAESPQISIHDCEFIKNETGLHVRNLNDGQPELYNLTMQENNYAGLRMSDGSWYWGPKNNLSISGSRFAVFAERLSWTVDSLELDNVGQHTFYDTRGSLLIQNSKIRGGQVGLHSADSLSISIANSQFSGMSSDAMQIYRCPSVSLSDMSASDNGGSGLLFQTRAKTDLQLSRSTFANNKYAGLRLDGVALDPNVSYDVSITGNTYGLMVQNSDLTLTPSMNLSISGNNYGAMCYSGAFVVQGLKLTDNQIGLYLWLGSLEVNDSYISASSQGITAYPAGHFVVRNTEVTGARHGVYLLPNRDEGQKLEISDCRLIDNSYMGIYVAQYNGSKPILNLDNSNISGSSLALYGASSTLNVSQCVFERTGSTAITQQNGSGNYRGLTITQAGNWGINATGNTMHLSGSTINQTPRGVLLGTLQGSVLNSVIQGGQTGIQTNNPSGDFQIFHTTVANMSHYALWHEQGNTTLRNSILLSNFYGIWNRNQRGTMTHDHNVVFAKENYVNETAGVGEIQKDPIFKNAKAGDFRLAAGSPAINSGADLTNLVAVDLVGSARPSFQKYEMGAYEYTDAAGSLRVLQWNEKAR